MAEQKLIENTKIEYVEDNERGGDPNLVFSFPNPLDEDQPQERTIRLWTKNKQGQVSEDTILNTQETLRKNLNDETITFAPTADDAEDTDIRHWAKKHQGEDIDNVYQNDQYYQLGLNTGTSSAGGSKFLSSYKPGQESEPYDPTKHRMGVFNAQTSDVQEAIKNHDTSHSEVYQKRNGTFGARFNHIIHDVVLESANQFGADTDKVTLSEFLDSTLDAYAMVKKPEAHKVTKEEMEDFKEKVDNEPHKHGYKEFMRLIGGTSAPRLPKQVAAVVKSSLETSDRTTLAFYVKNPRNGYIYRLSKSNANPDITDYEPNFLEYFTGDISRKDVTDFVSNLDIPNFREISLDILEKQLDGSVKNLDNPELGDVPTTVLNFIRAFVVNRKINVTTNIPKDGDFTRMGAYPRTIGKVSNIGTENISVKDNTPSETETTNSTSNEDSVNEIKDEDLPFTTKSKSEEKEDTESKKSKNPFAPADNGDNEEERATEETKEREGTNPFDV